VPRYFTLSQAEAALPELEDSLRQALSAKALLDQSETSLRSTAERVMFSGGVRLDRAKVLDELKHREALAGQLKELMESIQGHGCLIKDLDTGLLDFPTLFRGEEVYLCWKLGETGIGFWHGVDEGYRGRKPIDEEFRAEHRGE
jgi:hypothetical protein